MDFEDLADLIRVTSNQDAEENLQDFHFDLRSICILPIFLFEIGQQAAQALHEFIIHSHFLCDPIR